MSERLVREVVPWHEAWLRCGIGHRYRGRVRQVLRQRVDSDGEAFWPNDDPEHEYDADRCVVCGLLTWAAALQPPQEPA
jgi:hypothetical protein